MTVGWGVDSTVADGVVTSGTTSSDVRKVWGALYTPGIVDGCVVTRSGSAMTYTIASGVVAIPTGTKEAIMAPIQGTTINTLAAPATGTRVDLIYAEQRFPASGDSYVQVKVAHFDKDADAWMPANSIELDRYLVSAGQTNTNSAVRLHGINYSIPYGASLGTLHFWQNTFNGQLSLNLLREGHGTFTLPTDRRVRFSMSACLSSEGASGFDNSKYCEWYFLPNIQGPTVNGDMLIWTTDGLHQAWGTYNFEHSIDLPAGQYTTNIGAGRMVGPGRALLHYGADGAGFGRPGLIFRVEDYGPVL